MHNHYQSNSKWHCLLCLISFPLNLAKEDIVTETSYANYCWVFPIHKGQLSVAYQIKETLLFLNEDCVRVRLGMFSLRIEATQATDFPKNQ
jgi:hypothetical protein